MLRESLREDSERAITLAALVCDPGVDPPEERIGTAGAIRSFHAGEGVVDLAFAKVHAGQHGLGLPVTSPGLFQMLARSLVVLLHVLDGTQLGVDLLVDQELPA